MKIEDVMTRRVVAARADTDLAHVARLMWDNDCGSVPVVDAEDRVVGILTDRDVCMGAHFSGLPLGALRAGGSMAPDVLTCRPGDAPAEVLAAMAARRVRRAVVTDEAGTLLGMVGFADVLGAAAAAPARERRTLETAALQALARVVARPVTGELVPAAPKRARKASASRPGAGKKTAKAGGKAKARKQTARKAAGRKRAR